MNSEAPKGPSSRKELDTYAEIALELQKGLKALDYYKEGHPALSNLLDNSFNTIDMKMKGMETISISVKRRGLFSGFHLIGKGLKPLSDFAKDLYVRGIRKIFILQGLTDRDFNAFLRTVHMSPRDLQQSEGVEALLAERGVKSIWVNEINYDRLIATDLSYLGETEDVASVEGEGSHNLTTRNSPLAREQEENPKKADDFVQSAGDGYSLEELLEEIEGPVNDKRYREILGLMGPLIISELSEGRLGLPVKIVHVLSNQIDLSTQLSHEREWLILTKIREIAGEPVLKLLVEELCDRKSYRKTDSVLLKVGKPAVDILLDSLFGTDDRYCRRILVDLIAKFGSSASGRIKRRLQDDRWFVIRNMASILGEIGNRESLSELNRLLDHGEVKVRKEAIKALSKIGGREAASILIRRFDKMGKDLKGLIIFFLGVMEEQAATPLLIEAARKKRFFSPGMDARKEAILALGKLRATEAISTLEETLLSSKFLKNEPEELRLMAAESLAMIGTKDALKALQKGALSGSVDVKNICGKYISKIK